MTENPSPEESVFFQINSKYCEELQKGLGTDGKWLELLTQYLISCVPGCRTCRRKRSLNTDYDILCTWQGHFVDFRSELNRYFICECKDWNKVVGVSYIDKFYRVIKSVKTNFGIFISTKGVSGQKKYKFSEREIAKIYQSDGIVIVTIDINDINQVLNGVNFISLLREKYERIRFDLP